MTTFKKKNLNVKLITNMLILEIVDLVVELKLFKSYVKCVDDEHIYDYDVVSVYPSVNALDNYPVGLKQF